MANVPVSAAVDLPKAGELVITGLMDAGLQDIVHIPGSGVFEARVKSYWSLSPQLRPWAVIQPRTTEEVSKTVKALVAITDCQFAIRSGGHMSWPGASGIINGVTVDFGLLTETTYDPITKIASLQPGPRWTDVYSAVEKEGVMVAGGREGLVGVAGLLLGGGISYYSCRFGFACDQVINYEVVLGDGRVIEANEDTNADLFRALKGGGNNFGIVTRFDMKTFPAHDVWDGTIIHPISETDAIIDALVDLTNHLNTTENPAEHYLGLWTHSPQSPDMFIMSVITHLDAVEDSPTLQKFLSVPGQKNISTKSMASKVGAFLVPSDKYDIWLSMTFNNDKRIAKKSVETLEALVEHITTEHIPSGNYVAYSILQPFPSSFAKHSEARGGNMLGADRIPFDTSLLLVTAIQVETWEQAQAIFPKFKAGLDELEAFALLVGGAVDFKYGNYCDGSQNPFATYGEENIRRMKAAAAKYDPEGVFQKRVPGGFKLSNLDLR